MRAALEVGSVRVEGGPGTESLSLRSVNYEKRFWSLGGEGDELLTNLSNI